jgi:hypothetical protein
MKPRRCTSERNATAKTATNAPKVGYTKTLKLAWKGQQRSRLLARQLATEGALDLGDDLAVRDCLTILVRVDHLRLLVDRLRQLRLRHPLRRPRLLYCLAQPQADRLVCDVGEPEDTTINEW